MKKLRKTLHGMGIGAIAAAIALLLWAPGILDRLEYVSWSWRVELFAKPGAATHQVKLILLDQASLDWGEQENGWSWPWPREVYVPIIDFCRRSGARAVVFDVLFTEPSIYGVADDEILGAAIARAPCFVAPIGLGKQVGDRTRWPPEIPRRFPHIENLEEWMAAASGKNIVMPRAVFPVPEVAGNATILANVMEEPDVDGIFRRGYLFRMFDGQPVPALGLAADQAAALRKETRMRIDPGCLQIGARKIPIDEQGRVILRFRGSSGTHVSYSAAAVIQSELRIEAGEKPTIENPDVFKDCYVFLGFTAPGLLDLRPTPISKVYPGVEIYATMLDNLLSDDFIRETPKALVVVLTILLAMAGSVSVVFSRKAQHSMIAFGVFLPLPFLLGLIGYQRGFWWPVVVQEAAVALGLVGALAVNYATEGRQKMFIKHAFRHYLSPDVIERILEDPSQLKLGGERRELTILFSDLQGFSSISERLDPQLLTSLLNDYLSDMTEIILQEGGTLDKYEGDAIIAFWNAPLPQADHAVRACRAAIRCRRRLDARREELYRKSGAMLHARIGLNTGEVVVGNMGSRERFDYTVLGDAANLASRLEGANKVFGTWIMASESTWLQSKEKIAGREIGLLRVVGRKTPVKVYEPSGFCDEVECVESEIFHRGLALCFSGQWAEAIEIFESLPDDPVARVYATRCRALLRDPDAYWDGVWNLTEK